MDRKRVVSLFMVLVMFFSLLTGLSVGTNVSAENDMVVHLKFDGDLTDSSGEANNAECKNGSISYEEGIFGKCAVFNGKSYIEIEDKDSLDLSENFTISLWAYKEKNAKGDYVPFVNKGKDDDSWDFSSYLLYEHWFNAPSIFLHDQNGEEMNQFRLDGDIIDIRKWYLLTVTYDGSEVRIYENDKLLKRCSVTGSPTATIGDLYIGMQDDSIFYKGKMDDLRIYKRGLSDNEVAALYTSGLTSNPGLLTHKDSLVAYYKFEGNYNDSSLFGNDGKKASGTINFVDAVNGKGASFSKGSYIEVEDSDSLNFDTGFSATGWVCVKAESTTMTIFNRLGVSGSSDANEFAYRLSAWDEGCEFSYVPFIDPCGSDFTSYGFDKSLKNKWFHIAVTFSGDQIRWYKNGQLVDKKEFDGFELSHAGGKLMIGSDGENFLNGTLDELKLYNYALSAKQVAADASRKDSIYISSTNVNKLQNLKVKGTLTVAAIRKYIETGKTQKLTSGVTYKTSNKNIFTVSTTGKITAIRKGTAKLTITHGGISKTYKVIVK